MIKGKGLMYQGGYQNDIVDFLGCSRAYGRGVALRRS